MPTKLYQPKNEAAFTALVAAGLKYQNGRWAGPLFRFTAAQAVKYARLLVAEGAAKRRHA